MFLLVIGGSLGLTDDFCIPKKSPFGVQSERLINNIKYVRFQKRTQENTEALFILCPFSFVVLTMHTES